jgi:basic membrane protein A
MQACTSTRETLDPETGSFLDSFLRAVHDLCALGGRTLELDNAWSTPVENGYLPAETLGNVIDNRPDYPVTFLEENLRISSRKATIGGLALITTSALVLAGCAEAPEDTTGDGGSEGLDFQTCMVSDSGGFDDKSFNQLGYEGIIKAAEELGAQKPITVESEDETEYKDNIQSLLDQDCKLIVTVGFALSQPTVDAALANPDVEFVLIDDAADNDFNGETDAPNVKPIVFDTAEAGFLAGYLSAGMSETGKIGTFGGAPYPTVTIFMDGFKQGADYYNEVKGTSVATLGWDGTDGSFTGEFVAGPAATTTAQALIDQGIDVLLPVGGPIYQSAAAAIRDSGKSIALLGVDADVYFSDTTVADLLLTSVRKTIDLATFEAVVAAGKGNFDASTYVGTLANGGVGIAEYHDFASKVPAELDAEVQALKDAIIKGDIVVKSYLKG